jgi:hypothetical protein
MSQAAIREALEAALVTITPALATAWENRDFVKPAEGTAYQEAYVLFAAPDNPEMGGLYTERGFLQVNLQYPKGAGPAPSDARAALIRAKFLRGAAFVSSGITVTITKTPEVAPARIENDRYLVPVRIRFHAHIGG